MSILEEIETQVRWIGRRINSFTLRERFGLTLTAVDRRELRELEGRLAFERRRLENLNPQPPTLNFPS